jgi:hypothetical protein
LCLLLALPAGAAFGQPPLVQAFVPGPSLIALADSLWAEVSETGVVPEMMRLTLAAGREEEIAAPLAFSLLVATINLWRGQGLFPSQVLLPPAVPAPPQLDPQDILPRPSDPGRLPARQLAAASLMYQCPAVGQWILRTGALPTAVWIDGERYSAAEFFTAMAQLIQQASRRDRLPASLTVRRCAAPRSWSAEPRPAAGPGPAVAAIPAPPVSPPTSPRAPRGPRLTLLPHTGTKVAGSVSLLAAYSGEPPPMFVTFSIDGEQRYLTNSQPYSYVWSLHDVTPGEHRATVRAFAKRDEVLAEASVVLLVTAPAEAGGGGK